LKIDTELIRNNFVENSNRYRTHFEGCEYASNHPICAIVKLCDEVDKLTKELKEKDRVIEYLRNRE
jgi:hypothetical protein